MYERNSDVMCLVFICVYILIYRDRLVYTPSTHTHSYRGTRTCSAYILVFPALKLELAL